ncbi:NAD(+) diphosphatase [Schaalia sp. ZJ405]|uniref:NAD(+) diphosphatase n=1 Tax=Schaalia sp. ZJ405 TaxID=2709403 RepID=UPI001E5E1371|nr:NAD(+) diphosphatase [Schaalia sp. ZJ405]
MNIELPLVRGDVDACIPIREHCDPHVLLREGTRGLAGAGVEVTQVRAFLVTAQGEIALVGHSEEQEEVPPRLASFPVPLSEEMLNECDESYFIGVTRSWPTKRTTTRNSVATKPNEWGEGAESSSSMDTVAHVAIVGGQREGNERMLRGAQLTPSGAVWRPLRKVGHLLGGNEAALALSAIALAAWHHSFRYCPRCAAPVRQILGGWASECTGCGYVEYPRHDPAIIVRVDDGRGRTLLAHNTAWREGFVSTIAGFVEAGESPDQSVGRELMEEVGLSVDDMTYVGTQPWPFPRSQMLGYVAKIHAEDPVPRPDGAEIEWARFYSREELTEAILNGTVEAPGRASIAYAMLRDWYGGELPHGPLTSR